MFIWPDSIPPGVEFIFFAIFPMGLLLLTEAPLMALGQLNMLAAAIMAVIYVVQKSSLSNAWLVPALLTTYAVINFATNLLIGFCLRFI
ncbi:hypothetical protein [Algisphaera agarilytica]|uniref:Uncharacterized protein n=1 Tax=Algisphaera agarilytica TaxID=1385975 RepID=A0A7X0H736_9BACT|nr:hypothetical protein [Algisphaera agarilytica]MBB6430497.1 hypothetical protein [Algisphaera agarilytica]